MSYSLNTRGCVPVYVHYSNLPNCVCLQGQPRFQMSLNINPFITGPYVGYILCVVCGNAGLTYGTSQFYGLRCRSHGVKGLSKLMEIASIHLFIPYVRNTIFFGTIRLLAFSLVHAACKLQSMVVTITASLSYLSNILALLIKQ